MKSINLQKYSIKLNKLCSQKNILRGNVTKKIASTTNENNFMQN